MAGRKKTEAALEKETSIEENFARLEDIIKKLEDGESCWVLVHTVDDIKALFVSAFDQYDYGNRELYGQTWLAYRRPPEVSP